MADRLVLHVTPNANGWEVRQEGAQDTLALVDDKDRAVELAREQAKASALGQVIVHNQDGKIADEFTYGEDPPESPG